MTPSEEQVSDFRKLDLAVRQQKSLGLQTKYPGHAFAFVYSSERGLGRPVPLERVHKLIVRHTTSVHEFIATVRQKCTLGPEEALFFVAEDRDGAQHMIMGTQTMGELKKKYVHDDGFLYVVMQRENVFG